ncbi:alpha-tocopherol transfer protein-like [Drosophila miranda]|uniref:Alpha-tocopherol transfer protein-like n=1 Tax=Drosophila pseudoobscura pseudoobscura TaxID=46245 RepID=B5DQU3_DROPS|nr:alpha-tocopherol transfer protein-like [Drosophila pseudoobscura]XP_017138513.1 alpha-tocopherol transfer protein-like [Drosophila miranda]XP_026847263.1 alpha-tocopherol transfer protein-like [Drosophila persimilis]
MPPQIRALTPELQQTANEQLHEVPDRLEADLEAFKTWIKQQPHLNSRTDDQFLVAFLRGCKFSLERAKSKLDKYYTLRTKYPDHFNVTTTRGPKFREIHQTGALVYLPTPLNGNGPRIAIWRMGLCPVEKYNILECMQVAQAMQEITILEDDYANVNGIVFIMDMKGATAAHMFQMTPSMAKKFTVFSEEALPLRPKAQHFINTITGFEQVFNIFKPMMSKKMQGRLFVHGSKMGLLTEQVPLQYLSKNYGGENGAIEDIVAAWEKKFDEYEDFFQANATYRTDESLRPGNPIDFEGLFGIEGSFRKLNVD